MLDALTEFIHELIVEGARKGLDTAESVAYYASFDGRP